MIFQSLKKYCAQELNQSKLHQSDCKIALRTKNFIFQRNNSLKLRKSKNYIFRIEKELKDETPFIPKLKPKQLLSDPKFFISLQRKKMRVQNSIPSFQSVKMQSSQMKGSKVKSQLALLTRMNFFRQKTPKAQTSTNLQTTSTKSRIVQSFKQFSSQQNKENPIPNQDLSPLMNQSKALLNKSTSSSIQPLSLSMQKLIQLKKGKRPNLYENISFLIKRKREVRNKVRISRIVNEKRNSMTQMVREVGMG